MSWRIFLLESFEDLLDSLVGGTNLSGQTEIRPTDEAEVMYTRTEDPAANNPDADHLSVENKSIQKGSCLLRIIMTSCCNQLQSTKLIKFNLSM